MPYGLFRDLRSKKNRQLMSDIGSHHHLFFRLFCVDFTLNCPSTISPLLENQLNYRKRLELSNEFLDHQQQPLKRSKNFWTVLRKVNDSSLQMYDNFFNSFAFVRHQMNAQHFNSFELNNWLNCAWILHVSFITGTY